VKKNYYILERIASFLIMKKKYNVGDMLKKIIILWRILI